MRNLIAALTLALAPVSVVAQEVDPVARFEGLWAQQLSFPSGFAGALSVRRDGAGWLWRVGEAEVRTQTLTLVLEDGGGRFVGRLSRDGRRIEGWWTQPPGLPGQAFTTPVVLGARNGGWTGDIVPLQQGFTMALRITRNEEGRWIGAFRNREFNMNGGASRFFVRAEGERLDFVTPEGEVVRSAEVLADGLRLQWPPVPMPLELTRADVEAQRLYAPRVAGASGVLARPERTSDGWRTANPGDVGFDEAELTRLVQEIATGDPSSRRPQLIHSLLVARGGRLVLEQYFFGHDRDTPHDIRSAGKTFASVMLGALMHQGVDIGPQTRVYDFLAATPTDPRQRDITLAHLMTHTSGLDCNDNDDNSRGNEGAMQGQSEESDWWRFALALPMAHDPGARYAYCTAGMNLVGAALHQASGEDIPPLFDRLIARPLQFGRYYWNLAPNGQGYLGGGAYMRPRDLLKVGQLYLNGGVWNGRRIVSRDWVAQSTAPHVEINEGTTGMDAETFANIALRGADGYAWHRYGVRAGDRLIEAYEANGNGGQFLIVVPEYDLVVVMTGGNYGQGGIWNRWRHEIVGDRIIGALMR
jgi:CubicO group peptidase (beta-lactamase class C family)